MNMKKRIISLFMCFVMAFSLLPTAAWAELLPVTEDGQQEVVADPSGDEVQPGDAEENVGGEDADVGGAGEGDEDGQPEDGAPVEDGENGEDGGDNGDADAPAGEDAVPAAPQNDESGESNGVVNSVTEENAVAQIGEVYYATLPAALAAAQDGDTVTMLKDHVTDGSALNGLGDDFTFEAYASIVPVVTKQLTLDLNGNTVDYVQVGNVAVDAETQTITGVYPGNLTVKTTSGGTMGRIDDLDFVKGTLDIQGGQIGYYESGLSGGPAGGLTCNGDSGSVTISGGIVLGLTVGDGASVTVSGGSNHAGSWFNYGTLTITDGQFSYVYFQNNGTIAISGGTFGTITNTDGSKKISPMYLLAEGGYAFYDTEDKVVDGSKDEPLSNVTVKAHTHTIVDGKCDCGMTFVASVKSGENVSYYTTLQSAFDNAQDYATITLLTDVALAAPLNVKVNYTTFVSTFTLDLNGKKISCSNVDTATVFISATLTICDSSDEKIGEITQNAVYAVQTRQDGTLTITGGTFGQVGIFGSAEISGGTFSKISVFDYSGTNPEKLYTVLKDGYAFANSDSSIVNGYEKTSAENVTVVEHDHKGSPCACGYTCDHSAGMNSASGDCTSCGESIAQASVTAGESTTYYREFTNAINAAMESTANPTVKLWQDVTLSDEENIYIGTDFRRDYNLTIDWNGHILSGNTWRNLLVITQRANVTLKDSSGSNRGGVRNEYELISSVGGIAVCVTVQGGYCVTIEGGTYSAQVLKHNDCTGDLKIKGGVFENPTKANTDYAIFSCDNSRNDKGMLADLLVDGYTFAYDESGTKTLLDVYTTAHTDAGKTVYVVEHTHKYETTGKCACGKPCAHELINGICKNCGGTFVAQVGSGYYTTVTEALSAAGNNGTVTLLKDVTESVTFDAAGKSVTLNMNGKTLTAPDNSASALTVMNGTLTVEGDAVISNPTTADPYNQTITYAVSISGGKLVFQGNLTAKGGEFNIPGNRTEQTSAVYANGGELDFQKGLDLEGGLKITGSAALAHKLTQGTFRKSYSVSTSVSVEGSENYKNLEALLEDGYAFVDPDPDTTRKYPCIGDNNKIWAGSTVTIEAHTHTWGPTSSDLYECTVCGKSCAHEGGYKTGKCEVCGKPCPHDVADQSPVDHNYYCNDCGQQMFARIQTDTYEWSNFTNLTDALAAAENGQTVVLLGDINNDNQYAILTGDGKTVTLNLNGKTINGGWIQVGIDRNWNDQTSSTLKVVGSGSIMTSGNLSVGYKATLDLSGWVGGENDTISKVGMSKNGKADPNPESTLIVSEKTGTIGTLGFYSWPSAGVKTKLTGGTYGSISIVVQYNSEPYSSLLAEGYAFQYVDSGEYVEYTKTATNQGNTIYNVKVVKCEHASVTNGTCDYCNTTGIAALVSNGDGTKVYDTFAEAQTAWLASGGTLKLCKSVSNMATTAWTGASGKTYTLDLNGYNIAESDRNEDTGAGTYTITTTDMTLTVKDSSEDAKGQLDNLTLGENSDLTLESGWLGMLTVPNESTVKVQLKGGGLKGSDIKVPLACVLPDGYDLKEAPNLYYSGNTNNEYTVEKAPAAFTSGKKGDMHWGENKLPFTLSAAVVNSETEPTKITVAWYLRSGSVAISLADGEMVKTDSGWTYDSSKETPGYEAYGNLTIGSTYEVFAVVHAYDGSNGLPIWRAALTGYELTIVKADAVVTAPTAIEGLVYNGSERALVTAGKTSGGTLKYSLTWNGTYSTDIPTATDAKTYTVWYKVEGDERYNDTKPQSVQVTIAPKSIEGATVTLEQDSFVYDGNEKTPDVKSVVLDNVTLTSSTDYGYIVVKKSDVGTYSFTITGDGNYAGEVEATWKITAREVTPTIEVASCSYTGKAVRPAVTVKDDLGNVIAPEEYEVSYKDNINAGTATVTITDKDGGNYVVSGSKTFTIAKAALTVPVMTVDVTNGYATTYTVDLRAALNTVLPKGCRFGAVSYDSVTVDSDTKSYCNGTPKVTNGVLTLAVNNVNSSTEGNVATVTVTVETDNYQDITVKVQLNAVNKAVPVGAPTLSTRTITYGEKLNTIKLSGTMRVNGAAVKGTFAWAEPYSYPAVGTQTVTWVFTPESGEYAVVTGTETITVKEPAEPVYTVGGTVQDYSVTDENAKKSPIEGAVVTIRKGLEVIGGQKVTNADGVFELAGVVAGVYNVVVEYQGKTVTTKVELTDHDIRVTVEIPREDVNSELEIKTPTDLISDVVVGGLDKEAGEQFKDSGKGSVSVGMDITEPPHSTEDAAQNAIRGSEELTGKTLDFIDLVLTMVKNGTESTLEKTTTVLEIIISYDTTRKDIKVVRHHVEGNDEEVSGLTQLDTLPDEGAGVDGTFYIDYEKKCIHIFASKFSTYAIGYTPESDQRYYYNSGTADAKPGESPATGDVGLLPYAAMALTGCTGVVVLTFRRKREHE